MKRTFLIAIFAIVSMAASAQIPYFADPLGKGTVYGYADLGFRPGTDYNDFNTYWQYGFTDWLDAGFDYAMEDGYSDMAVTAKFGHVFSQWIGISAMIQPWFTMTEKFQFEGLLTTLILQGSLTRNGKLTWLSNTGLGCFNDLDGVAGQLWYLGYNFNFKNEDTLTPMIGVEHSWKFDEDAMPTAGLYYTHKWLGVYLWSSDLLNSFPRFGIGLDFTF